MCSQRQDGADLTPVPCAVVTFPSLVPCLSLCLCLQLDQSLLHALKTEIQAKAEIKGNLDTYKYYDNVSLSLGSTRKERRGG